MLCAMTQSIRSCAFVSIKALPDSMILARYTLDPPRDRPPPDGLFLCALAAVSPIRQRTPRFRLSSTKHGQTDEDSTSPCRRAIFGIVLCRLFGGFFASKYDRPSVRLATAGHGGARAGPGGHVPKLPTAPAKGHHRAPGRRPGGEGRDIRTWLR
jgi:hypothetical protein